MMANIEELKANVNFAALVSETYDIGPDHKVRCPAHDDARPSCHIYKDHAYCFVCGWYADHLTWLASVHQVDYRSAVVQLTRRVDGMLIPVIPRLPINKVSATPKVKPVAAEMCRRHDHRAAQLRHHPSSMGERGFTLDDLKLFQMAACGNDVVFPLPSPDGTVMALKRRYANAKGRLRYAYLTTGHGTPPWCSPGFLERNSVLVVEGELNGMACWLAAPDLAVMGIAGTNRSLYLDELKGRSVFVYADGDDAGQEARSKWAMQALAAGAAKVFILEPWPMDACVVAGRNGRAGLVAALTASLKNAQPFDAANAFDASLAASKDMRPALHKPDLMLSRSRLSSRPRLGSKPCL